MMLLFGKHFMNIRFRRAMLGWLVLIALAGSHCSPPDDQNSVSGRVSCHSISATTANPSCPLNHPLDGHPELAELRERLEEEGRKHGCFHTGRITHESGVSVVPFSRELYSQRMKRSSGLSGHLSAICTVSLRC